MNGMLLGMPRTQSFADVNESVLKKYKVRIMNSKRLGKASKYSVFLLIWLYILVKIFIYDIDRQAINYFAPRYVSWLDYRYFLYIGLAASLWLIYGSKRFWLLLVQWLIFPINIAFWEFPKLLYKRRNWGVYLLTYLNFIVNFLKHLKWHVVGLAIYSIGTLLALKSANLYVVSSGCVVLFIVLVFHYFSRIRVALNPSSFLALDADIMHHGFSQNPQIVAEFEKFKSIRSEKLEDDGIVTSLEEQLEDESKTSLQTLYIYNRVYLFLATNIQKFQKMRVYILPFILSILMTFFLTALTYTVATQSIYRMAKESYVVTTNGSFFDFFYYSFNAILMNQVGIIVPNTGFTRFIDMSAMFFGFLIVGVLLAILFTTRQERYKENLDSVVEAAKVNEEALETLINSNYSLTLDEAHQELENIKNSVIKIISTITKEVTDK